MRNLMIAGFIASFAFMSVGAIAADKPHEKDICVENKFTMGRYTMEPGVMEFRRKAGKADVYHESLISTKTTYLTAVNVRGVTEQGANICFVEHGYREMCAVIESAHYCTDKA